MVTAIIVAAGKSERMGAGTDKAFLNLGPKPVVAWSLLAFERCADVDQIVLVVRKDQLIAAKAVVRMFGISKVRAVVAGGAKRQDSVMNGLKELDVDTRFVVVHDGARPCVRPETISEVVKLARRAGAAVVGSSHEFHRTPEHAELIYRLRKMQDMGADILKVAVMPQNKADVLTLLSATEEMYRLYAQRPLLTMSMASDGVISRLCGEVFGSAATFGMVGQGSAPGQIPADQLEQVLEILHRAL